MSFSDYLKKITYTMNHTRLLNIEYIFILIVPGKYNAVTAELGITDSLQGDGFKGYSLEKSHQTVITGG